MDTVTESSVSRNYRLNDLASLNNKVHFIAFKTKTIKRELNNEFGEITGQWRLLMNNSYK